MSTFEEIAVGDTVFKSGCHGYSKHRIDAKFKKYLVLCNGEKYSYDGSIRPYGSGQEHILLPSPNVETIYEEQLLKKYRFYISQKILDTEAISDSQVRILIKIVTNFLPEHN